MSSEEFTAGPSTNDFPSQDNRLRLRLHHLFALTAVMAVMLAIGGPRDVRGVETPRLLQTFSITVGIVFTILTSVAITIVAYGIAWRRNGLTFFHQPGHWLLVMIAIERLVQVGPLLIGHAIASLLGSADDQLEIPFLLIVWFTVWPVPGVALAIMNIYIGRKMCPEEHWRRVFYSMAAAAIVPGLGDLLVLWFLEKAVVAEKPRRRPARMFQQPRGYVEPVIVEHWQNRSRDSADWCGVILQFSLTTMNILIMGGILSWMCFRFLQL